MAVMHNSPGRHAQSQAECVHNSAGTHAQRPAVSMHFPGGVRIFEEEGQYIDLRNVFPEEDIFPEFTHRTGDVNYMDF